MSIIMMFAFIVVLYFDPSTLFLALSLLHIVPFVWVTALVAVCMTHDCQYAVYTVGLYALRKNHHIVENGRRVKKENEKRNKKKRKRERSDLTSLLLLEAVKVRYLYQSKYSNIANNFFDFSLDLAAISYLFWYFCSHSRKVLRHDENAEHDRIEFK